MLALPYFIGHTDQSWYSVEEDYQGMYTRRGPWEHLRSLSWNQWRKAFSFPSIWYEVSLSNSQVNSLWRKTLRVQSLWKAFSFKLTLMCPVHVINQYRKYIRNVKTPLHKHLHYWANDGEVLCNRKALMSSVFERCEDLFWGECAVKCNQYWIVFHFSHS